MDNFNLKRKFLYYTLNGDGTHGEYGNLHSTDHVNMDIYHDNTNSYYAFMGCKTCGIPIPNSKERDILKEICQPLQEYFHNLKIPKYSYKHYNNIHDQNNTNREYFKSFYDIHHRCEINISSPKNKILKEIKYTYFYDLKIKTKTRQVYNICIEYEYSKKGGKYFAIDLRRCGGELEGTGRYYNVHIYVYLSKP